MSPIQSAPNDHPLITITLADLMRIVANLPDPKTSGPRHNVQVPNEAFYDPPCNVFVTGDGKTTPLPGPCPTSVIEFAHDGKAWNITQPHLIKLVPHTPP